MKILAIESSCDETAAAVVEDGIKVLGSAIASSAIMHEKYGGIVPEVAAREQLKCVIPTIEEALRQANTTLDLIDKLAVTIGPGLIGSLLVGVETAKTIAMVKGLPVIPVNHVLAHMYANFVKGEHITFPAISLVVSGGHTELFLMKNEKNLAWLGGTLDDAAGEAFDKTARLLGFGSRGGPAIQEAAKGTAISPMSLPRPIMHDGTLNFSFSGLKTAILREVNKLKNTDTFTDVTIGQLAYEVQESITDVLVNKTLHAVNLYDAKSILISGGVAANMRLREKFNEKLKNSHTICSFHAPPVPLCTDNAIYIGAYAYFRGKSCNWHDITAIPDLSVEDV